MPLTTNKNQSVFIVAPIVKKPGAGPPSKYGTGKSASTAKHQGGKILAVSPSKIQSVKPNNATPIKIQPSKAFVTPSTSKPSPPISYTTPKSSKSTTFGIIWLPSKKHNRKKDLVQNSQRPDYRYKERAPSMYNFMSGDSHHSNNKEEDSEKHLLVPDRLPVAIAGASATAVVEPAVITTPPEGEKEELINPDKEKEESKEESTFIHRNEKDSSDYLVHNDSTEKSMDNKSNQDRGDKEDKVDSVYLRPPPPHKARSNTSTPAAEDEDCGIKCLYYTLQCCDCVLM